VIVIFFFRKKKRTLHNFVAAGIKIRRRGPNKDEGLNEVTSW